MVDYQKDLNQGQHEVVTRADGPVLVLAGAGSGKTRVLVYRLAYLLDQGVSPRNIMLATFTNKAAREMTTRAEILLRKDLKSLWSGTFHHIGHMILRREAERIGLSQHFTIIDVEDACALIDDCIEELGFHKHGKLFPKKDLIGTIWSLAVNAQKNTEQIINEFYPHTQEYAEEIKKILTLFVRKKKEAQLVDFNDLLLLWLELLRNDEVCEKYSSGFQYILVDEYQDTNRLQFEILVRLSSIHRNILVVGDDAQSIYSFRAAEVRNILDFPKIFPDAKVFKLEVNYRSSPEILELANQIIRNNQEQFPKELKAIKPSASVPLVVTTKDVYHQAEFVAKTIIEFIREDAKLSDIAVLFRSRFQALELEMELIKRNIPYIIRGGVRFFEQAHIKDTIAFLRILTNPQDEISFKRALCLYESIGRGYAAKIWGHIVKDKKNFQDICNILPQRQRKGFGEFYQLVSLIKKKENPQEALSEIISFYKEYCYVTFENPDDRLADLAELEKMAGKYPSTRSFLDDIGSYEEFKGESVVGYSEREDMLVLSTIHQAKGLEWESVFLIGFSEYDFPHPKSLKNKQSYEEERRLFYVAATRAKKHFSIVYPARKYTPREGAILARPSPFLKELSSHAVHELCLYDYETSSLESSVADDDFFI